MYQIIIVIHVLLGLGVIGLVMMQQGKGADAGAAFGTGSAGSVFGAQGSASFLSKATAILATSFFITSLGLAVINGHKGAAYDLMSGENTSPELSISTEKKIDAQPELPSVSEVAKPVEAANDAEIKSIEVPKAEEIKVVK